MGKKNKVELRALTSDVEGENLVIRVKIFNPEQRTLYAYGTRRRILYDNATGKLTLCLHDQHVQEDSAVSLHLAEPRLVQLEGNTETEISISLPKVIKRIRSAAERGETGPSTELLQVSEAEEVQLEIAYNDTPFYHNPKVDNAKQLKEWGRVIARDAFQLKPRKSTGD